MTQLIMSDLMVEVAGKKYDISGETVLRKEVGGEFFYLGENTEFIVCELPKEWKKGDSITIFPNPQYYYGWTGTIVDVNKNVFTLRMKWFGG